MNILFPPIQIKKSDFLREYGAEKVSREELLAAFDLSLNTSGGYHPDIFIHRGFENVKNREFGILIGIGSNLLFSKQSAATALEILAHHFHDYPIRESICGKNLTHIFELSNPDVQGEALKLRERIEKNRQCQQQMCLPRMRPHYLLLLSGLNL